MKNFSLLDTVVFCAYIGIVALIAFLVSRSKKGEEKTTRDYFLAGNTLPWWAIGTSLIAANISAEQLIGMTGDGFTMGLAIASYEWMAAATLIVVGKFFLPVFLEKKIYSMPQFLEMRYDNRVRTSLALFWLVLYVFVNLTSIIYLGAVTIHQVFDVSFLHAAIAIAVFSTLYSVMGGLKAIAFTDPIQVTFLVIGGLITAYLTLDTYSHGGGMIGGLTQLVNDPALNDKFHMIFSSDNKHYGALPGAFGVFGAMWIANLNYWGCNQYITQRALAAKSLDEAQRGIILAGFLKLLMPLIVVVPGIVAYALHSNDIARPDGAYPFLMNNYLFSGVRGIAFAALVAAVVGSLSSKTNSIATIFTMDVFKPFFGARSSERSLITVGRITTVASLVIAVPLAVWLEANISKVGGGGFQFIQTFTGFFSPGIFCIFIFGLFWKRATANGAIWVAMLTLPVALLFYFTPGLDVLPFLDKMAIIFGILSLVMIAISLNEKQERDPKAITITNALFKTSNVFNAGAIVIIAILVVLYRMFW